MGCDIHFLTQVNIDGTWTTIWDEIPLKDRYYYLSEEELKNRYPSIDPDAKVKIPFYDHRDYAVFALFADVRNDLDIEPISKPRGIPKDLKFNPQHPYIDTLWMGDHSFTWFTFLELFDRMNQLTSKEENFYLHYFRHKYYPKFIDLAFKYGPKNVRFVMGFDS